MKKFLLFILVFLTSKLTLFSCGFSPYGEEVRFSFFLPDYFSYQDFNAFHYNANIPGTDLKPVVAYEANVYDWYAYVHKQVSLDEIQACLQSLTITDIHPHSTNAFLHYLYAYRCASAIMYLKTAKQCEALCTIQEDDVWERNETNNSHVVRVLQQLHHRLAWEKDPYFKRKYAFLAIRTAYYSKQWNVIEKVYDAYFSGTVKDYLYYWATYFHLFTQKKISYDLVNVFIHAPEKRYAVFYYFNNQFHLKEALAQAHQAEDSANIYAYASIQRLDPNIETIQKVYSLQPNARILDFLLLREINKLEDWVYTPYYTNFLPSVEFAHSYAEATEESVSILRNRSEKDRLYAAKLKQFLQRVDFSAVSNPALWKAVQIQLSFLTKDKNACIAQSKAFIQAYPHDIIIPEIEKIMALSLLSDSTINTAQIPDEAKSILLTYANDQHFLFAAGRELEFKGNVSDGLALISLANKQCYTDYQSFYYKGISWQDNRLKQSGNLVYFYDYFDYIDFVYSADELQLVVNRIEKLQSDPFFDRMYRQLLLDKNYLKDMLGTKYIRENRLKLADATFTQLGETYWDENYNAWERDRFDERYAFYLNPFYQLKYTSDFIPNSNPFIVSKWSITRHLIECNDKASDPNNPQRAYYYFLLGNAYLGMSQYGDAWMMRRFNTSSTGYHINDSYIDELEYARAELAQQYYHQAYLFGHTTTWKALCLRMEDYAKDNVNSSFPLLKKSFPEYYDELSGCENLEAFFKSETHE